MKPLFIVILMLATSVCTHARILQVGPGLSYANIQPAVSAANPGDTIILNSGTYAAGQWLDNVQGSAAAWIHIRAQEYGRVIVDGGSEAWHFVDPAFVRVWGITFQNQTGNGVNCDDGGTYVTPAKHIIFDSCQWLGMTATGNNDELKLSGVDSFQIVNCIFKNGSAGGSAIDMVGCHSGTFFRNTFENQGSNSIQAKGGTRFIRIEANLFANGGERALNLGGSTGLAFFRPDTAHYEAADLYAYSNVFIGSYSPIAYVGCINAEVVNNTIFMPEHWVIRILQETVDTTRFHPCGNNSFRNNIIYLADNLPTECNIGSNTAPSTFTMSNNLWYNYQNASWTGPGGLPVTDQNRIIGQNPNFTDTARRDFSITATSPAARAGCVIAQPAADFTGRPFGSPRSIGAYEATSSAVERKLSSGGLKAGSIITMVAGQITVTYSQPYSRYRLMDIGGKTLRSGGLSSRGSTSVKLSDISSGILVITLDGKESSQPYKFVNSR